jgi:hypothetical protein
VVFEGSFECANIEQVRRRDPHCFDVWMRNDSNGTGLLQWFYFKMRNVNGFVGTVRINIVNFTKSNSLFTHVSLLLSNDFILNRECNPPFGLSTIVRLSMTTRAGTRAVRISPMRGRPTREK